MLSQDEIRALIAQMKARGVQFAEGLNESELRQVEQRYFKGARFPPDLRAFLQVAMPVYYEDPEAGPEPDSDSDSDWDGRTIKFPNWRDPEAYERFKEELHLNDIGEEIMFDIAENGVWYWGDKPSTISAAQKKVRGLLRKAPRLIPICNRRFMATEPQSHGQPVLSIFSATDIIFYGKDLADFLAEEFKFERVRPAPRHIQAEIPFWHALATANEARCT